MSMFSLVATLFLTPELNACHQNLGNLALYTTKKKNVTTSPKDLELANFSMEK